MFKLPFMLSNKDWEELAPKRINDLGKRTDLPPEQQQFLDVFRVVDLRVEWVCKRIVFLNNIVVVIAAVVILFVILSLKNPKIVELLLRIVPAAP